VCGLQVASAEFVALDEEDGRRLSANPNSRWNLLPHYDKFFKVLVKPSRYFRRNTRGNAFDLV
jgi:hypothetical protein